MSKQLASNPADECDHQRKDLLKVVKRIGRPVAELMSAVRPRHWGALRVVLAQAGGRPKPVAPTDRNLKAAIGWLKSANDAAGRNGVSWGYRARVPARSNDALGWLPPYPETTGYIIETLLRYSRMTGDVDCRERAREMADWETNLQLPDGGIQGGVIGSGNVAFSTFVTGQVIFGWLSAFREFGNEKYLNAACRAGDLLYDSLDEQGRFTRGYSRFCAPGPKAYEARTGWAMAELGKASGKEKYSHAALRMCNYSASCQQPNGWFQENDLQDHAAPLTHTIGYTLEGLTAVARILDQNRLLEPAGLALERISGLIDTDGFLAGRWTSEWKPAAAWCCLTGSCQIATVYFQMQRSRQDSRFVDTGRKLLSFVAGTQLLDNSNAGLAGGIHGSYPFNGAYGSYSVLNWATKFYADAVMDYLSAPRLVE